MNEKPTHLDLFSGIGGFSLAFEAEGFKTIGFSEINPYAGKILKQTWPHVTNFGDIKNVRGIRADVLTGGFPCQPFSIAGKRRGASDDRALWPEMLRIIDETKPHWVVGENVAGIISLELDRVLSDLENLGYSAWPLVIPACAVDARHRRDRVWILANSNRTAGKEQWLSKPVPEKFNSTGCFSKTVAHTESGRARKLSARQGHEGQRTPDVDRRGETVADAEELQNGTLQQRPIPANARPTCDGPDSPACWPVEPELGRVADGIPDRSHRLKGLGNAIVWQVAQVIARKIYQMSYA